jgi:hypothetical protein
LQTFTLLRISIALAVPVISWCAICSVTKLRKRLFRPSILRLQLLVKLIAYSTRRAFHPYCWAVKAIGICSCYCKGSILSRNYWIVRVPMACTEFKSALPMQNRKRLVKFWQSRTFSNKHFRTFSNIRLIGNFSTMVFDTQSLVKLRWIMCVWWRRSCMDHMEHFHTPNIHVLHTKFCAQCDRSQFVVPISYFYVDVENHFQISRTTPIKHSQEARVQG